MRGEKQIMIVYRNISAKSRNHVHAETRWKKINNACNGNGKSKVVKGKAFKYIRVHPSKQIIDRSIVQVQSDAYAQIHRHRHRHLGLRH